MTQNMAISHYPIYLFLLAFATECRKFAQEMIRQIWEGYDISGADVQDIALKCGLLYEDVATEADVDRSEFSASDTEVGDTIYRFAEFMKS